MPRAELPPVAFLCHPYHRGGVTRWMADAAIEWVTRGGTAWFVAPVPREPFPSGGGRPTLAELFDGVSPAPRLVTPPVGFSFELGTSAFRATTYARAVRGGVPPGTPVVVSDDPSVWSAAASLTDRHPFVGVLHSDEDAYYELATRHGDSAAALVCVSRRIQRRVMTLGLAVQQVATIPCGIVLADEAVPRSGSRIARLAWVGRIEEGQKRVSDLVPIASRLLAAGFDFHLDIIGSGPDSSELRADVDRAGLGEHVTMHGWMEAARVREHMRRADVLLMPSNFEGQSVALMEALAEGCGAVASRVSGVEDLESFPIASRCLRLFDVGDVDAATRAVLDLLAVDARQRTEAARQLAQSEFSIESCVDRYAELLRALQPVAQTMAAPRVVARRSARLASDAAAALLSRPVAVARAARRRIGGAREAAIDHRASTGRRLLLCAWEYPGANSRQGSALARRVGQIARGFARAGWHVEVLHRRATPEDTPDVWHDVPSGHRGGTIRRMSIDGPSLTPARSSTIRRRIRTVTSALRGGDRSSEWARLARARLSRCAAPDLVIGCFTPRGPIALAGAAARRWAVPWIVDLQDPALEGAPKPLASLVRRWMRRATKRATFVVQVSPEWRDASARELERDVLCVRHAVPAGPVVRAAHSREHPRDLRRFALTFHGNVLLPDQRPDVFLRGFMAARSDLASAPTPISLELRVAGTAATVDVFRAALPAGSDASAITALGWLDSAALAAELQAADALLLLACEATERPCVPSKLFEQIVSGRPIIVAGADSGGVASLLQEWGHPDVIARGNEDIRDALVRAATGDDSRLLVPSRCSTAPLDEEGLAAKFLDLATRATRDTRGFTSIRASGAALLTTTLGGE